ncbi:putative reverse transcriptase zinc-binding domain-containing protein [Rosa chinensis]|uniref:Putative reverse transcriptase zinc-binding domain-containing protein n=1 Tax=Rosa chinensis TaxID=74649 RepID=A0A2P6R2R9_ROSCH|nr:putative reverse transcriptase zinc-binding domain-containing protein [Rosa chinensis]
MLEFQCEVQWPFLYLEFDLEFDLQTRFEVSLLKKVEGWCRNFFWSGSIDKRGIPLISWKTCCLPYEEGGLGLKQLVVLNRSLLLKRCWDVFSSNSPGGTFIRARFWRNGNVRRSYAASSIWPGVKKFWQIVYDSSRWLIGSGSKVSFWRDKFLERPLIDFFEGHIGMVDDLNGTVADFISNGAWNLPPLLQLHFPGLCDLIEQVPIASDPLSIDELIWSAASSGKLTAKDSFQFLRPHAPSASWSKSIWSKFITPRMSLLAWQVLHARVLSEDLLQRRGIALASRCGLCCKNVESVEHIFLNCSFASAIWLFLLHNFELGALPSSLLNVYNCGLHAGRSAQLKELWMVAFTTALWFIWNSRNKVRFDSVVVHATNVFGMIVGHIQASSRLVTGRSIAFDWCEYLPPITANGACLILYNFELITCEDKLDTLLGSVLIKA